MILATFSFGFLLITESYVPDAYSALAGPAKEYDHMMKARYAQIERVKSASTDERFTIEFESIENSPRILVFSDITRDKNDWQNSCFAKYFGLSEVVRK